ncbi:6-phosphofructokinase [Desulfurispira natronophila]|uniref:ATP-dependent 6-phosphofructokinase n=1 Tax=Desulfurispira natronophila TaxID=682562 RepID=A0A7W8DGV1_9BACT|nr:ATP-dependent 6-phosphofructokinase [Desulfurispira natronophila]MBB5021633.1 6-phosphofructokinase 1 [Desulfurispira natronophila]
MPIEIKKIAISTGGGDCPGLNAVIRAVVRTATLKYGWEVVGIKDGLQGVMDTTTKLIPLNRHNVAGFLQKGGTVLGTTNRGNPFEIQKEVDGKIVTEDISDDVVENIRRERIDAVVGIGGDGTMLIMNQLYQKGIPIVGVPKTIDNDLLSTDVTFGFDTAVAIATDALDRLQTTAASHHRVMVVELMGRYAGWIAMHSGIAGGAEVILIPEIPYDINKVAELINQRMKREGFAIVVVAEGAKPLGGSHSTLEKAGSSVERLGGIGYKVAAEIEELTGAEVRTTVLGHVQRGGSPTAYDRVLSTRFGVAAADLIHEGGFGRMVTLRGTEINDVTFEDAIENLKFVDPEGQLVRAAEEIGVCLGR